MPDAGQTGSGRHRKIRYMNEAVVPAIVAAERLKDGIMVRFSDGKCVFYSTALLYRSINMAELHNETEVVW